jgi:hypothetical protein
MKLKLPLAWMEKRKSLLQRVSLILLLFVGQTVLGADATAAGEALLINGNFESVNGADIPSWASTGGHVFSTTGQEKSPTGWVINPAYPGEAMVIGAALDTHENILKLSQTTSKPLGVLYYRGFKAEASSYCFHFFYRGNGTIWGAVSLWQGKQFLTSANTRKLSTNSDDWLEADMTVAVEANKGADTITPAIYVTQGPVEIRNLTISPSAP